MRVATIDIGTNTVLMLISEIIDNDIKIVAQFHEIVRLGEGLSKSGIISDNAKNRLINLLKDYHKKCTDFNTDKIIATGTSAFRDANNNDEVLIEVLNQTGIKINIISGDEEAKFSFAGAVDTNKKSLLIDIGGGSTEVIIGENEETTFSKSIDIGAVRLTEKFFSSQPPTLCEVKKAKEWINDELNKWLDGTISKDVENYYGVAGTVTTIAATVLNTTDDDIKKYDNYKLTFDNLIKTYKGYITSSTQEIIEKFGVHPKRADLISAGALILVSVFEFFKIKELIVSSKGLRFGILKYKDSF